jgi:peptide chain release factor 1
MFDKLQSIEDKYEQMAAEMADPAVQSDNAKFRTLSKAVAETQPLGEAFREYKRVLGEI